MLTPEEKIADLTRVKEQAAAGKGAHQRLPIYSAAHKAAEEMRLEGHGSHDPMYKHSKKNK